MPQARPIEVRTHHSSVSRFFREEAESLIKQRSETGIDAIISTSTLELGIDIGELDQVVQIDALVSPSAFLQRVGRTGRRPGHPQIFKGLCLRRDDLPLVTATVELGLAGRSEALRFPQRAFHILAHQIMCLSLQQNGITADKSWEILRGAWCFSLIEETEVAELVRHMIDEDYLRTDGNLLLIGEKGEHRFLRANWRRLFAVFDSAPLYDVYSGKEQVGTLDVGFVEVLETPFNFVLAGKLWTAKSVDTKAKIVRAIPAKIATAPKWSSFGGMDVPFETAQKAGSLLTGDQVPEFLDDEALRIFREQQIRTANLGWSPGTVILITVPGKILIVTFAGDRINRTLSRLVQAREISRATSDYQSITVDIRDHDTYELARSLEVLLHQLRERGDPGDIVDEISNILPRFRFSPFAECLPDNLYIAAIVEEHLDCEGLVEFLRKNQLHLEKLGYIDPGQP